jgi:Tol biopolymer transport system component
MDNTDIWLMNADGSDKRQLTDGFEDEGAPRWLPDSRTIMYISGAIDIDGNVMEPGPIYTDAVSPDGLLFLVIRSEIFAEDMESEEPIVRPNLVWVAPMDDRAAQVPITAEACNHFYPTWSPDGSQVVLTQSCPHDPGENEVGIERLNIINVDGSNHRVLTEGMEEYLYPNWRPNPNE